jgi:sec-independent protein translocase protein TatB
MFDVGFSELCMLGIVALLVIGPEKLPKVARVAGYWLGKAKAVAANAKAELAQELQAEEMRQMLKDQHLNLQHFQQEINQNLQPTAEQQPANSGAANKVIRANDPE